MYDTVLFTNNRRIKLCNKRTASKEERTGNQVPFFSFSLLIFLRNGIAENEAITVLLLALQMQYPPPHGCQERHEHGHTLFVSPICCRIFVFRNRLRENC